MTTFDEIVKERHSVRAFDPVRAVADALLLECLELARHSPSNCNAQPWRVFVVARERCVRLRDRLLAAANANVPVDERATPDFVAEHRARQIACAVEMYTRMGITREDRVGRRQAELRNFAFFDAPHIALLCMPERLGVGVALDVGIYLQTLMLALQSRGIASCAQASMRCYAGIIKTEIGIPEGWHLLAGVAFGYPVPGAAVNDVRQGRAGLAETVTFVG